MGVVQNFFLACENPLPMKYIIPENIFDMTDLWSSAYMTLHIRFCTYSRGGGGACRFWLQKDFEKLFWFHILILSIIFDFSSCRRRLPDMGETAGIEIKGTIRFKAG